MITQPNILQTTNLLIAWPLNEGSNHAWSWFSPVLGQGISPSLSIYIRGVEPSFDHSIQDFIAIVPSLPDKRKTLGWIKILIKIPEIIEAKQF